MNNFHRCTSVTRCSKEIIAVASDESLLLYVIENENLSVKKKLGLVERVVDFQFGQLFFSHGRWVGVLDFRYRPKHTFDVVKMIPTGDVLNPKLTVESMEESQLFLLVRLNIYILINEFLVERITSRISPRNYKPKQVRYCSHH